MPGRMGGKRATQRGSRSSQVDAEHNLLLVRGARPRPQGRHGGGADRWLTAPKAPVLGKQAKADLPAAVFGEEFHESLVHEAARADLNCPPPRHRVDPGPRRGLDDRRQGVAPEGHRPRPRRRAQRAPPPGRRRRLRPEAARLHREGEPQGPPPRAALGAVGARRPRHASRCSTADAFASPRPRRRPRRSTKWGAKGPTLVIRRRPTRPRSSRAFATSRACRVLPASAVGVADVVGAGSLVVSEAALEVLEAARPARSRARRGRTS